MLSPVTLLRCAGAPERFLAILEQTRQKYRFVVVGYVVMPEHIHLLITEPEIGTPSTVMQVLKQRTAHALLPKRRRKDPRQRRLFGYEPRRAFWQARFYDFNVWSTKKRVEKLRYVHNNPVKRGLVDSPELWAWSSYRYYHLDETGPVQLDVGWGEILFAIGRLKIKISRGRQHRSRPCKKRKSGAPPVGEVWAQRLRLKGRATRRQERERMGQPARSRKK